MKRIVAQWQTRGARGARGQFLTLYHDPTGCYTYEGNDCGGVLPKMTYDAAAIAYMERPPLGPAFILKCDFPSTKRIIS